MAFGLVSVIENEQLLRIEMYEPHDRRAMIARYAELGGGLSALGDRPPERIVAEFMRLTAQRHLDEAFVELIADDQVVVDRRRLG